MSTLELNHKNGREVNSPGAYPPPLNNHGLGSEAPKSVQAPISAPSTTPLDPVAITPAAARTHAQGLALQLVRFGGALATYVYPLGSERLPQKLVHAKIWLVWRSVSKADPSKKPDKVPFYVTGVRRNGSLDSPEDRAQLASFDEAIDAYWQGGYEGLAIALGPDGSGNCWQGIDFDDVEQRQLSDLANTLPGYVDFSPSGKGCHAIGYGRPFRTLGSNDSGVEAYAEKRFFTFTGSIIRNTGIGCIADFVERHVARVHGATRRRDASHSDNVFVDPRTVTELRSALNHMRSDDRELWINMGHALHGLGNLGRGIWLDWSKISEKFSPEDAKKWDGFKPDSTDYRAVFAEAQRQGWINPNSNVARGAAENAGVDSIDPDNFYALPSPKLEPAGLYGILGEIAKAGSAKTEAVPAALAINTLARFCATIGGGVHVAIGDETRSLRPFVLIIGPTGMGRKGTSAQLPMRIFQRVEAYLGQHGLIIPPLRTETAVSSGEGLVWMVRDAKEEDPGINDKRVLLEISEFSGTLAQARRDSSVLTAVLRDVWASPSFPDTFNDMMCSGEGNDEDKKELHGRIQT